MHKSITYWKIQEIQLSIGYVFELMRGQNQHQI